MVYSLLVTRGKFIESVAYRIKVLNDELRVLRSELDELLDKGPFYYQRLEIIHKEITHKSKELEQLHKLND